MVCTFITCHTSVTNGYEKQATCYFKLEYDDRQLWLIGLMKYWEAA
jgi:hypothetical protein